jgi:hypothetical protein
MPKRTTQKKFIRWKSQSCFTTKENEGRAELESDGATTFKFQEAKSLQIEWLIENVEMKLNYITANENLHMIKPAREDSWSELYRITDE